MKANKSMQLLLEENGIDLSETAGENADYPIWCKTDAQGRAYWGVAHFWGLDKHPINPEQDLSLLEWDGNEIWLAAHTHAQTADMLRQTIGIFRFWRKEIEAKYPDIAFYLYASYDKGDLLEPDEGDEPTCSITLRLWADRGNNNIICLDTFDDRDQPLLIDHCCSSRKNALEKQ